MDKLAAITQEAKKKELELWKSYKTGDQQALEQLFKGFEPVFNNFHQQMKRYPIPDSVQKAEIDKWFMHALDTYDPNRGAALGTHVHNILPKAKRLNYSYSNVAYIPEDTVLKIGTHDMTFSRLESQLNREPTVAEMADELKWAPSEIERVQKSKIADLPESNLMATPWDQQSDAEDVLFYLYLELDPTEKMVFENTFGYKGRPKLKADQIAGKAGITIPDVARIRKKLNDRLRQFI